MYIEPFGFLNRVETSKTMSNYMIMTHTVHVYEIKNVIYVMNTLLCKSVWLQVSKDSLRSYIGQLITVLLECFKDDSWPVRDGEGYHLIFSVIQCVNYCMLSCFQLPAWLVVTLWHATQKSAGM